MHVVYKYIIIELCRGHVCDQPMPVFYFSVKKIKCSGFSVRKKINIQYLAAETQKQIPPLHKKGQPLIIVIAIVFEIDSVCIQLQLHRIYWVLLKYIK